MFQMNSSQIEEPERRREMNHSSYFHRKVKLAMADIFAFLSEGKIFQITNFSRLYKLAKVEYVFDMVPEKADVE